VSGVVVDAYTGAPVSGATVMLRDQGLSATSGAAGDFRISRANPGTDAVMVIAYGYADAEQPVELFNGQSVDMGRILITDNDNLTDYYQTQDDMLFDENALEDEEAAGQSIGASIGASDDIYYNAANYDFSIMYFRQRGYDRWYQQTSINGINFNDLARGMFNYSTLGGMNRAFRAKTTSIGLGAAAFSFGDIGGTTDISAYAHEYAPGFYGSVAYTNAAYMFRAMGLYSTGVNRHGWALTVGAVGRYSNEGIVPGTFYNSAGYFLSVSKVLNPKHTLSLTAFGAPTQRGGTTNTTDEARELAGTNLYNPMWGWQDGKKRNAKVIETFDPTFILNWLYKEKSGTTLNTGLAVRWVNYSSSALAYYNAENPMADYYRKMPSWYKDNEQMFDYYTALWSNSDPMRLINWNYPGEWHNSGSVRQINWDKLYAANYYNNEWNDDPAHANSQRGASYILEDRHSNQFNLIFNSTLNHRLNDFMTLQGGISFNYTRASYYKTVRDLLGGDYWVDVDMYTEGNYPENPDIAINDLNNPMAHAVVGDRFGYDYDINAIRAEAWAQNMITLPHWDINYGLKLTYTQFQRDGKMRNGRFPDKSYGKGEINRFDDGAFKFGAVYKLDGRNFFTVHGEYATRAPLLDKAYVAPRSRDGVISGLSSERILSLDLGYVWNYHRFRGSVTGFVTGMSDATERSSFYDDNYGTFMNYTLTGIRKVYKGVEVGAAYKITPSITASLAGTIADYRYKNNPRGTRNYDNGTKPDTTQTVYLKNYHLSGTPSKAVSLGIDYAAPGMWFFSIDGVWLGDAYVNLTPVRHEAMPNLWQNFPSYDALKGKIEEFSRQEKLNNAFVLNASVGKVIYLNRKASLNLNLSVNNLLNNRNVQTYGYQQGRTDTTNYTLTKFPNKYSYAQGIRLFFNAGIRF